MENKNDKKENVKVYREYRDCNYPVILINSDFCIIYKNNAARFSNIKPRMGMNMKKYMDSENIGKLRDTLENKKSNTVTLNVQSIIKRCVARYESEDSVIALLFFDSLNFLKDDDYETFDQLNFIMSKYDEQIKSVEFSKMLETESLSENEDVGNNFYENDKKTMRIREHFRKYVANLHLIDSEQSKNYCDIGIFLRNFNSGISPHINALGYKINFNTEDNMFMYKLNESDFMTVNFILTAFALENSVFGKIKINFGTYGSMTGILKYEFTASGDFHNTHKNMFKNNYYENIGGIEYLDLSLCALILRNNNIKLNISFNEDNGNNVYIELIFDSKFELESPIYNEYINSVTAESAQLQAAIEFSMLKKFSDNIL